MYGLIEISEGLWIDPSKVRLVEVPKHPECDRKYVWVHYEGEKHMQSDRLTCESHDEALAAARMIVDKVNELA